MNSHTLKIIGSGCNALAALILAIRVKNILDAVASALTCHEANIQQLMKEITGRNRENIVNFANSPEQVAKAQKTGAKLFVLAFILLFVGNVLQAIATAMEK